MWAYFNVWEHVSHVGDNAFRFDLPFLLVPVTRLLSEGEEVQMVQYFCKNGEKVLPQSPMFQSALVDGGDIYNFPPLEIQEFDRLASAANNFTDIDRIAINEIFYGKGPLDGSSWLMYVKRMKVPGKAELLELCVRAIQNVEDKKASSGGMVFTPSAEHGTSAESSQ